MISFKMIGITLAFLGVSAGVNMEFNEPTFKSVPEPGVSEVVRECFWGDAVGLDGNSLDTSFWKRHCHWYQKTWVGSLPKFVEIK